MAVRMNVLMLRPIGNGSAMHHQFDDVIGQLLGRPGLDLTLLERLPGPDEASTERLALESLGGHIACLAWADPGVTVGELTVAGKPMTRRAHMSDPTPNDDNLPDDLISTPGRMFYFDMRKSGSNQTILNDLQGLLKRLQTPMFQIGGPTALAPRDKPKTPMVSNADSPPRSRDISPALIAPQAPQASAEPMSDQHLDRLVDELDEMDL